MQEKKRVHVFVSGKVQGVFFRQQTKNKAQELELKGWVRNLADKRVEAVFEGEKEKIEQMIKWLEKGPILAKVEKLDIEWQEFKGDLKNFEIKYDKN